MEAMGTAFTTIAQASAAGDQGGPSDLQRFRAHHPPTFKGGGDPVVVDHLIPAGRESFGGYRDYL